MAARSDVEWTKFMALCTELRGVKNAKMVLTAVEKLQSFLSDDRARQLVHRWRSWGFLLSCLLNVLKEETRAYLNPGGRKRATGRRSKMPQLRYWHYLRTELETAHVTADGPLLHLDPNGRDCICQLLAFSAAVIDRQTSVEFDRSFETQVDKEAWLTVEVLVQFRVYCAVLDYKDWKNMLEVAMGSFSPSLGNTLIGDKDTAATRARVMRFLVRNCTFDLTGLLPVLVKEIGDWFEAGKSASMERDADSLLLVVASTLMDTLTELMRMYFGSIAPFMLKRGVAVLEFIGKSTKTRKNGLRGAPAEFVLQFLELYRHNVISVPDFCYLTTTKLLREMTKLVQVVMGSDELNLMMAHFNSAREQRLGNALGIDDQGIRHLACAADIIFHHDCLVSERRQNTEKVTQDELTFDHFDLGSKRPRFTSAELAWEIVIEHFFDSPRTDTQYTASSSASPTSQRQPSAVSYLSRDSRASQARRTEVKQANDSGSWLLLLLSILSRHGDYYMTNRIGDLMTVMQKLGDMLVVKEMGKWQSLTLQILIQMATLSARHREECNEYLNEHWANVWRHLFRPELPYARVTEGIGLMRGQAGDAVLTLLNCCISFGLVSEDTIERSSSDLWNLPAFRQPASDTPISRGDSMRPYARTSMASICTLLSLLRRVQLPVGSDLPTADSQDIRSLSIGDEIFDTEHESVQLRLLRSVFDHLRAQVFRRSIISSTSSSATSFTRVDLQTEVSPMIYVSALRSFFGHMTPDTGIQEAIFVPELIRKLSARNADECDSWSTGEELNGFGVAFCMLETGLEYLSFASPPTAGLQPTAFSPAVVAFNNKVVGTDDLRWYDGVKSREMKFDDHFERLAIPHGIMGKLFPSQNRFYRVVDRCTYAQSISKKNTDVLQTEITNLFSDLLTEISSKLPSDGCSPIKGLRVLANSVDVGLVLATLYADEVAGMRSGSSLRNENCVRVLPLLKHFFEIIAGYLKPSVIKQAQQSQSMSESLVSILRVLHTLILVLQGRQALEKCQHPSADLIKLQTPPELRPSVRAIVYTLEESLAVFSGGADTHDNSPAQKTSMPRVRTGFSSSRGTPSWESTSSRSSTLYHHTQPTQKEWDAMDDGEDDAITRDRPPSRVIQKNISLWCFRVILLLKQDSGLSSVTKYVEEIQFDPDYVLAVAVLLCGVPGPDSMEAFVKLVDNAAEEGMSDNLMLSTARRGSCRASIFLSQVLSALVLAGLVYEKRKYQSDGPPPVLLVECVQKHLNAMAGIASNTKLRMARRAELQCLEVFFRLSPREFSAFEEACVTGLTDSDVSVRIVAARGLQSIFFMYPDGGERVFRHCFRTLESLLDGPVTNVETSTIAETTTDDAEDETRRSGQDVVDPRLCMDSCLTVLLSVYVSACSSETALPAVLRSCVELASMTVSLYGAGAPSLISKWLNAIAGFYGYANVSILLDDHFCSLWSGFISASHRAPIEGEEESLWWMKNEPIAPLPPGSTLLEQFPLESLLGEELDLSARKEHFMEKLDMIFPIGVFHSFISGDTSGVKGGRFSFVDELVSYFSFDSQGDTGRPLYAESDISKQLTTDLFAFAFILVAYPDDASKQHAYRMLELAEERAQQVTLSFAHLGHIASKMARFTVWSIVQGDNSETISQSELWRDALKALKEKYLEFDWGLVNLADLLGEFYVILLRTDLFDPRAERAVECFKIFALEIRDAMAKNSVLQQLLLTICFQSMKQLAVKNRRRIGTILSLLVREICECFMKKADMFGKYLGFVVHEISDILTKCNVTSQRGSQDGFMSVPKLCLSADDQAELEWIVFAVCNELGSGLGKYALDIDMVPNGISASLDKLNVLILESRKNVSSEESQDENEHIVKALCHSSSSQRNQAKQQIQMFIRREARGNKFYKPLPLGGTLQVANTTTTKDAAQTSTRSFSDVRLSAVTASIDSVRDSSLSTKNMYGKLAHILLYLSSSGTFGSDNTNQEKDMTSLAEALGELGALDASEYELSLAEQDGELQRLYRRHFRRGALREMKTSFSLAMHEGVLIYLSSIIFESGSSGNVNPSVLEKILKTLKSVLSLGVGKEALDRCKDGELKSFLNPFQTSLSPSNWSSASPGIAANWEHQPKLTLRHITKLWTSADKLGFKAWVCALTSCLAKYSPDPVLKACSSMVTMRVDMAVFLFPYALESILRYSGDQMNTDDMSKAEEKSNDKEQYVRIAKVINQGVKFVLTGAANNQPNTADSIRLERSDVPTLNTSQPPQVVQLLIHSINFLREVEKARFVETNGKGQQKPSTAKGKGSRGASSGAAQAASGPSRVNELAYGCMIDVDLLAVAQAAVHVKMPYSAMQYVEMWLEKRHGGKFTSLSSLQNDHVINTLCDILVDAYNFNSDDDGIYGVNDGRTLKSQLVKYNREGQHAKALPLYDVSLQFSGTSEHRGGGMTSKNPAQLLEGMLTSLQSLGYNHLLEGYLQSLQRDAQSLISGSGSTSTSTQALENKYELAWKSMQWEAVLPGLLSSQEGFNNPRIKTRFSQQQTIFQALRSIAHGDFAQLQNITSKAKEHILRSIQLSLHSFESTKESYSALVHLQELRQIEELASHMNKPTVIAETSGFPVIRSGFSSLDDTIVVSQAETLAAMPLLEQWQRRHDQIKNDFDKAERLLALEEILLQVAKPSDNTRVLMKIYLDLASLSRKAGRIAVAYRALLKLEELDHGGSLSIYERMQWKIQKAKLLWRQLESRSAIWTGKKVCTELTTHLQDSLLSAAESTSLQLLRVKVLTITGKWIASQRSESSQVILEEYFQKATEIMSALDAEAVSKRAGDAAKAHFALAEFMAAMYQQVSSRVTSREWLAGKKVVQARHEELQELQSMEEDMQKENRAHIHALNKEVVHDINERSKVEASVDQFLIGALCSYGKGLSLSSQPELDMVFRVLSLWFNNQHKADINRIVIEEVIDAVPSYKFVSLSYQIISRISSSTDSGTFQIALRKLVMKLSAQHPHHTLVQLIALKNSGDVEGKGALQFRANVGDAKAEGAKMYLAELQKTEQRELLESLDSIASAYVQLALFDTSAYHAQKKKISLSEVIIFGPSGKTSFDQCLRARTRRGASVEIPAVLTSHITPQADMNYSNVVRMFSFEPLFSITDSGIHRPKIIYCYGSDGETYKQLVKGQDDTRQDLVIEQVFETMNQFLMDEKETRKRKLRLRTYRVIPLSPIAGVLEWVENTIPWGSYLVSRISKRLSAHERYHPHEWKHTECRQYLKNAPEKLPAFLEIQSHFTPVFHHFFLEKFPDAAEWYHRRLAYVQSAAVTSIVGYILGIGDRHSQNILIHEETGELVHIDFGVVFDQGMALFTPETVPFRLTRDMVDGMGISGVDGVFSRCCEVTLQLLRKKSASVVTILEVFVHDPLYRWTLSPLKALRIQEGEQDGTKSTVASRKSNRSNSNNAISGTGSNFDTEPVEEMLAEPGSTDAAARALIRVKQKLEGYEDPNGSALSIEGQVKQLLSAAQDPHNLCKIFPGWAPWL